jgi:hypothetical protein
MKSVTDSRLLALVAALGLTATLALAGGTAPPGANAPSEVKSGHAHEASERHGGDVSMTKVHHFETVFAPDGIRIYLYTEEQAPELLDTAKGTATLMFKDGTSKEIPLSVGDPAPGEKTVYFCPMHSDVVQMEPGICTKCGKMELYVQNRLFGAYDLSKVAPGTMKAFIKVKGLGGDEPEVSFASAYKAPSEGSEPKKGAGDKPGAPNEAKTPKKS